MKELTIKERATVAKTEQIKEHIQDFRKKAGEVKEGVDLVKLATKLKRRHRKKLKQVDNG